MALREKRLTPPPRLHVTARVTARERGSKIDLNIDHENAAPKAVKKVIIREKYFMVGNPHKKSRLPTNLRKEKWKIWKKRREKCFEDAQTGALRPRLCISVGYWSSYIFCTTHRLSKARKNEKIFADILYTISRSNQQNETSVEMKITKTCVTPVEQRECWARLWEWGTITLSAVALGRAHMTHLLERYCIKSADQLQLRALPTSAQSTCWEVNPEPQNQRWKSNLKYEK